MSRGARRGGSGRGFYGWWIVGAGFSLEALSARSCFTPTGPTSSCSARNLGWSKTMLSAAFAMARAESGILGPVQGWLTDRFGPQILIRVGNDDLRRGLHASEPDRLTGHVLPHIFHARARLEPRRIPADQRGHRQLVPAQEGAGAVDQLDGDVGGRTPDANCGPRAHASAGGGRRSCPACSSSSSACRCRASSDTGPKRMASRPMVTRPRPSRWGARRAPAPRPSTSPRAEAMRAPALWLIAAGHGSALLVVSAAMVHFVTDVTELGSGSPSARLRSSWR